MCWREVRSPTTLSLALPSLLSKAHYALSTCTCPFYHYCMQHASLAKVVFVEPGAARDLAPTSAPTTEFRSRPQSSRFFHSTNHNRWLIKIMFRMASRVPISSRRGSLRSECLNPGLRLAQLILHRSPRRSHLKITRTARLPISFQILLPHSTPNPSSAVQSTHCHTRWVAHLHKGNL